MRWGKLKKPLALKEVLDHVCKYDPMKDGITYSILNDFQHCFRKGFLKVSGWESMITKTTYANGTIVHDCLDFCYNHLRDTGDFPSWKDIKNYIKNYDKRNPEWLPKQPTELLEKFKQVAYVIVTEYIKKYKHETTSFEILGVEEVFDIKWQGYRLRGKKDMVVEVDGKKWVFETKNYARISEVDTLGRLTMDLQSLFYTFCEIEEYQEPCHGVIYSINRNPGHQVKKDETLKQYCYRLRGEIQKKPNHFYKRYHTFFSKNQMEDFQYELIDKLDDVKRICRMQKRHYPNQNACLFPFKCEFFNACSSGNMAGYSKSRNLFRELED